MTDNQGGDQVDEFDDEMANNLLMTGALLAALTMTPVAMEVEPVHDAQGNVQNQLVVRADFLSSPYVVTVERVGGGA